MRKYETAFCGFDGGGEEVQFWFFLVGCHQQSVRRNDFKRLMAGNSVCVERTDEFIRTPKG